MRDFIMNWLDPIGVVVGLVISVPVFWTWWDVVFGRRRRERRWFYEIRRTPGNRPGILIVDLLVGKDVRPAVERYRQQVSELQAIPEERILVIRRDAKLTPEAVPDFQRELRRTAAELLKQGVDTVHCFYAGPAAVAAMVGAEFANGARMLVYQHDGSGYQNFGPLRSVL